MQPVPEYFAKNKVKHMILLIKDTLLAACLSLTGVGVVYLQYFAPYALQKYAMILWVTFALSGLLFLMFSTTGQDFISYLKASRAELRKVVWPKLPEVTSATRAVMIMVAIISVLVSFLDSMFVWVLARITG